MAQPKLLLHPGTHKTGTTAIQESLDANRSWLAARGVAYPKLFVGKRRHARKAHHVLAKALVDPDDKKSLQRYCRQVEKASEGARLTVLSAEPIYRFALPHKGGDFLSGHRIYLERLRQLLRDFDISVLVYFRRPDRFAISLYKNMVANGNRVGPFGEYATRTPWQYDYPRRIALFRDVFGGVETRCYELEAKKGLVAGFYSALGLEEPPAGDPGEIRVSHTNRATLWLRRELTENVDRQIHQQRALFARESASNALFAEPEPSTLWPSDEAFTAFVERFRSAYEIGPFDPPKPPDCPTTQWTDEMHAAAGAAFAQWQQVNSKRLSQRSAARAGLWWQADPSTPGRFSHRLATRLRQWWQADPV